MAEESQARRSLSPGVPGDPNPVWGPATPIPEKWLREALFHSSIGVAITDKTRHFIRVNEAYCRITGYSQDELASLDWVTLTHPDDREHNLSLSRQMYAGELPGYTLEKRYIKKDCTTVWVRNTATLFRKDSNAPECVLVLVEDIDARKRMEELVAEVHRLTHIGIWEWDLATDAVTWSDEVYRATGYDPTKPPPKLREQFHLFTPESWERVSRAMKDTLRTGVPYELDLEVILPSDGRKRWVIARGGAVKNNSGQIVRLRGTIQDITERRQQEEAARDSERKFVTAFHCSPQVFTLCTVKEDRYLDVNEGFERTFGYTRQEVIGHTTEELGIWEDRTEQEKLATRAFAGERISNAECRFRKKNGEIFTGLLSGEFVDIAGEHCVVATVVDITDWKRAQEAVRSLQAKLALHFEQTLLGVIEWDREGRVNAWNPAAENIFGYTRAGALGRHFRELIVPQEIFGHLKSVFTALLDQTGGRFTTNQNVTKDGRRIVCEWVNTPLVEENGEIVGVMSLVRDITAENQARVELASSQATLSALVNSTDDMIWTVDAGRFGLTSFNAALTNYFAHNLGLLIRVGMTPDDISKEHAPGWNQAYAGARDTGAYEFEYLVPSTNRLLHVSLRPLVQDGRVFGISAFARDITESQRRYQELRQNEERLRFTLEANSEGVWDWNIPSGKAYFSPRYARMLGYEPEEFPADYASWKTLVHPEDFDRVDRAHAAHIHNREEFCVEFRMRTKTGGWCWIRSRGAVIERDANDRAIRMVGTHLDITKRKQTEEALVASEERYRTLVESSHDWVWEVDAEGIYTFLGPQCEKILGYVPDELIGKRPFDLMPPQEAARVAEVFGRISAAKKPFHMLENVNLHKNGESVVLETNGVPFFDAAGKFLGYRGMDRDVTGRKQAEEALRQSERKFATLFRATPAAIGVNTLDGTFVAVNNTFEVVTGYTSEEVIGRTALDLGLWTDPNQRRLLRDKVLAGDTVRDVEHRFRTKSGHSRIGSLSIELIEINGERHVLTVVSDISERKRAEEAMQESERKFATLFRTAPTAIRLSSPPDGGFIDVNDAFEAMTGYSREEALGRTALDLGLFVNPQDREQLLRRLLAGDSVRNLEHVFRRKSGELRVGSLSADLIEVSGQRRVLTVVTDITEQKRAQDALRASEEQFRGIAENLPGVVYQFYARHTGEWGVYYVHERAREVLGISPEPLETFGARISACAAPEERKRWIESIQQAVASASTWQHETRLIKPSGEEIYIKGIARPQRRENELVYHGILLDVTDRKRAETALQESEARLHLAAAAGRMYAFDWDPATDILHRSAECAEILGMPPTIIRGKSQEFVTRMHHTDRKQYLITLAGLSPESPCFTVPYRFLRPDGTTIWLEDRVRGFFDGRGTLLRTVGMTADITARKQAEQELRELSGKLITALEDERKRVARELHDGASQSLALASMELESAETKTSVKDLRKSIKRVCGKVQEISSDISRLSHQLHPSILKYLGLAPAIAELCREVSHGTGVKVEFTEKNVPGSLASDTALCLYRVAQEALQNIVKHSQATTASVQITGADHELRLCIWDNGIGFDTDSASHGLGLISMRERLRLVDGTLRITSHPGAGTRIEADVDES